MISDCRKFAQIDYIKIHEWVGPIIHWELYKKFKFYHMDKWYMESVSKNEMCKLILDFEIKRNRPILFKRPRDTKQITENLPNWGLCCSGWHWVKLIESEKKDEYLGLTRELKKKSNMEHESDGETIATSTLGTVTK